MASEPKKCSDRQKKRRDSFSKNNGIGCRHYGPESDIQFVVAAMSHNPAAQAVHPDARQ
jgi:hypothetical protein